MIQRWRVQLLSWHHHIVTLGNLLTSMCLFHHQYSYVPAKEWFHYVAGNITVGHALHLAAYRIRLLYECIASCHARTLFLFTYAKIAYVSVRAYPSQIQYIRYISSSLDGSLPPGRRATTRPCSHITLGRLVTDQWYKKVVPYLITSA